MSSAIINYQVHLYTITHILILLIAVPVCFIDNADTYSLKSHSSLKIRHSSFNFKYIIQTSNRQKGQNMKRTSVSSILYIQGPQVQSRRISSVPNVEYGSISVHRVPTIEEVPTYSQLLSNLHSIN